MLGPEGKQFPSGHFFCIVKTEVDNINEMVFALIRSENIKPKIKMKYSIVLFPMPKVWMAKHSNPLIVSLFQTDTLPTPFASSCNPEKVRKAIAALNPDCSVSVDANSIAEREYESECESEEAKRNEESAHGRDY